MMDLDTAAHFIATRLATGELTTFDLARIVADYQARHGLVADGMPGNATLAAVRPALLLKAFPLPVLGDGRKPRITSGFKTRNKARPNHNGCDLFYRWQPSDGDVRLGDGGATRDEHGRPKWFIPSGTKAIAAAAGTVTVVRSTATGHCVWVNHSDGHRTGYFHLTDTCVEVDQVVAMGTPLGTVGDNPIDVDAKHLHFEVSPIDRYEPMDPEPWLDGAGYWEG